MKNIDRSGLLLCGLQAEAFELSMKSLLCSSEIFIRRFMNSETARLLDNGHYSDRVLTPGEILALVDKQYGTSTYGKIKYSADELYWIGYLYRYYSYTYELSSAQIYRQIKPRELRLMYPACHTMDCAQAMERILEAKEIEPEMSIEKQYRLFRKIRHPDVDNGDGSDCQPSPMPAAGLSPKS